MPALEIERKFLVRGVPQGTPISICQGYLALGAPEVRVRQTLNHAELTIKGPETGGGIASVRAEEPVRLDFDQATRLLAMTPHVLQKARYRVGRWEIDAYEGDLKGLLIAEIELSDEREDLPPLPVGLEIVRELTADKRFKNQALASASAEVRRALVSEALRWAESDPNG